MSEVKVGFPFADGDIQHFTFEDKSTVKITVNSQHSQVMELFNMFLKMLSVASHEVVQHVWRCNQQPTQPSHKFIIIKLFNMKIQSAAKHKPWSCSTVWRQSQQPTQPSHEDINLFNMKIQSTATQAVKLFSKQRWLVVCSGHQMWNEGCDNGHLNWLQNSYLACKWEYIRHKVMTWVTSSCWFGWKLCTELSLWYSFKFI